jgi:transcriptional regulator with XRE-family HTH domain
MEVKGMNRVIEARKSLGITPLEMSRRLNVQYCKYHCFEDSSVKPTKAQLLDMARILEIDAEILSKEVGQIKY